MKVITLISGGDSGGAKTHVHSLLQNLSRTIEVTMVCFLEGPFAQEARELGIPTVAVCSEADRTALIKRSERNPIVTKLLEGAMKGRTHQLLHVEYKRPDKA